MEQNGIITTVELTKTYGDIIAVDHLNLTINSGEIFGLLGPNGAGKTTTILMLMGLTEPTSGSLRVDGYDPLRDALEVKRIVGYMPDNIGFYDDMTGRENLRYTAWLNHFCGDEAEARIQSLLEKVGLAESADRKVKEYSRGMRQRLGIADVLLKDPKIVILDEPTLGLDPKGARELLDMIKDMGRKEGKTVIISSHLLFQVQSVCDRVGIFVKGKLIAVGKIKELAARLSSGSSVIEIKAEPKERLTDVVKSVAGVTETEMEGDMLLVKGDGENLAPRIVAELAARSMAVYHLRIREYSLDDIYRQYFQGEEVTPSGISKL
ncbi:MAG: type transport system ATP-binding protein [Tepidanaerobacteraceae bacterium]|nr:type transport system ATP-binding protein [Tepidanaerobacteraceae bacterium]